MRKERQDNSMIEMDDVFHERVYAQVARIPSGKVCTYGKIGELAGYTRASREVGLAMSRAPEGARLPCHRVVYKDGALAPDYAFGGRDRQRKLLENEGIAFNPDGCINMQKHMWPDDPPGRQLTLFE